MTELGTAGRPVFLDYCHQALRRLGSDGSPEAAALTSELQALQRTIMAWGGATPSDKQRVIARVLDAYSRTMRLTTAERPEKRA